MIKNLQVRICLPRRVICLIAVYFCAAFVCMRGTYGQDADSLKTFILGADVSYVEELEKNGAVFKEAGEAADLFAILSRNGLNTVRLRLWHSPADEWYDLESTVALAHRVKNAGLDLFLDFHYSDTWADPGRQNKPAAWDGLSFDVLRDSLYNYTHRVISRLNDEAVLPAYVQVGNEISQGLLWDEGRVGGDFNSALQWSQLRTLLSDAIRAVRDVSGGSDVQIVIHTDRGGDVAGATWFFDNVTSSSLDFDMIGLSYYPWWHGTMEAMQQTINTVADKYGKPVLLAETGYPWTLQWFDNTNNLVGLPEHLLPEYTDLPDAQYRFLRDLVTTVRAVPGGLGAGVCYWAPEFMAVPGVGSVWENVALFDNNGEMLPAMRAFRDALNVNTEQPETNDVPALKIYPNPFLHQFKLTLNNATPGLVTIALYDTLGRKRVSVLENRWLAQGIHSFNVDGSGLPAGLYISSFQGPEGQQAKAIVRR